MKQAYEISFRCYYGQPGNYTTHYMTLPLWEIPRWIEAYNYTHPGVRSISVKIWYKEDGKR